MEATFKLLQVFDTVQRAFTTKAGESKTFLTRGLILSNGFDSMYCEQIGPSTLTPLVNGKNYRVQYQIKFHKWTAQDNTERYQNDISIIKMEQAYV